MKGELIRLHLVVIYPFNNDRLRLIAIVLQTSSGIWNRQVSQANKLNIQSESYFGPLPSI